MAAYHPTIFNCSFCRNELQFCQQWRVMYQPSHGGTKKFHSALSYSALRFLTHTRLYRAAACTWKKNKKFLCNMFSRFQRRSPACVLAMRVDGFYRIFFCFVGCLILKWERGEGWHRARSSRRVQFFGRRRSPRQVRLYYNLNQTAGARRIGNNGRSSNPRQTSIKTAGENNSNVGNDRRALYRRSSRRTCSTIIDFRNAPTSESGRDVVVAGRPHTDRHPSTWRNIDYLSPTMNNRVEFAYYQAETFGEEGEAGRRRRGQRRVGSDAELSRWVTRYRK